MSSFQFDFSNPAHSQGASQLWLHGQGLIRATGPEAQGFLQSQLTNDAKQVTPAQGQLSGYCSPKGRLLAVFTLLCLGPDDFALALPLPLVAPTLKRLRMFVLRSKLSLSDASTELPALGVMGEAAPALLASLGFVVPGSDYGTTQHQGAYLLRRPGPLPCFELRAAAPQLAAWQQALKLPIASAEDWAQAELLAGTPQVLAETVDHFVPQTIDLDSAGGVSFTKGCYPGQEIVARVHYLGRVKQRLHLAACTVGATAGTPVFEADGSGQPVGTVMVASSAAQGFYLSMALQLDHGHSNALRLGAADGPAIGLPQQKYPPA